MKIRKHRSVALAFVAIASFSAALFGPSAPSGATVHNYDVVMVEGSIDVNDTMFETPGVGVEECPGNTAINGTISSTSPHTVTGTIEINSPFTSPLDGEHYVLEATGVANTHGTYNTANGTFSGLHFSNIAFSLWTLNTEDCTTAHRVCVGTATLTVEGGLYNGATLPLSTGEQIYVNGHGNITSVPFSTCEFIWWALLSGADLAIGPNTTIGTSPGAIFEET